MELHAQLWDVVVVGSGPAGASAAYVAAKAGMNVLLLERSELPRYKTCGGGIIGTSERLLPPGAQAPVKDRVRAVTFSLNGRFARTRWSALPLFTLVNRDEFDFALTRAAVDEGAILLTGVTVSEVEWEERLATESDVVRVVTRNGPTFRTRSVVGADGSASRIARSVGVSYDQVDLGLEAEIPVDCSVATQWAGRIALDWGPLPGSYGWVFPKGDSLTVGVIAQRSRGADVRAYLDAFIRRLELESFQPIIRSGHLTKCRAVNSPVYRDKVLLAGDAAGLLDPWTREGISFALRSGRLAGEYASRLARTKDLAHRLRSGRAYHDAIMADVATEMRAGRVLLGSFSRWPWAFHAAVTTLKSAWDGFGDFSRGNGSLEHIAFDKTAVRRLVKNITARSLR